MDFMEKITKFTQKVGESAQDTYKNVAEKSDKFIKVKKHQFEISEKKNEIEDIYINLGKTVYDMYKKGEKVGDFFTKEGKKIEKLEKDIENLEDLILLNKDLRKCENCFEIISIDTQYCKNCGFKQKKLKIKEEEPKKDIKQEEIIEIVCSNCQSVNEPDSKFCSNCGIDLTKTKKDDKKVTNKKIVKKEEKKK